jgi:hypothetical protein
MGTTPIYGFPYPDPSDLVANYPALGQQLAEDVEDVIDARKVLQVVNATFATSTTTTSATFVTSGLSASITPSSATSKILIIHDGAGDHRSATNVSCATIFRGTVAGTNLGNATFGLLTLYVNATTMISSMSMHYLDSPATTSSVTYTIGIRAAAGATLIAQYNSTPSVITLMEVSA